MRRVRVKVALAGAAAAALGAGAVAVATGGGDVEEKLTGYEEVPALSTPGVGEFRASVDAVGRRDPLPADVQRPRVDRHPGPHPLREPDEQRADRRVPVLEPRQRSGGHAGLPGRRRDHHAARSGPRTSAPAPRRRGIAAGEFDEFVRAIRAGATYVNVHSDGRPGGEIRAQLGDDHGHGHHDDHD